jgi:endonuclease-3
VLLALIFLYPLNSAFPRELHLICKANYHPLSRFFTPHSPSIMTRKDLYNYCISYFEENIPLAETELNYANPYELLVSVILSAQCTDKRVNMTTPELFKAFPTAEAMAAVEADEIFPYIKSISYPNNKAKHLAGMARKLVAEHKGEVPCNFNELITLPGVGRKTANVIISVLFDQPAIAVDTHVFRVSQRIGLVKPSKTPLEVEKQLVKNVPPELQGKFHHWLILHGRYTCTAKNPKHEDCGLRDVCKYYGKAMKGDKSKENHTIQNTNHKKTTK